MNRIVSVSAHLLLSLFSVNKWSCRQELTIWPSSFSRCSSEPDLCPLALFGLQWSMSNYKGITAIHHQLTHSPSNIGCQTFSPSGWHRERVTIKYKSFHSLLPPPTCLISRTRKIRKSRLKWKLNWVREWLQLSLTYRGTCTQYKEVGSGGTLCGRTHTLK